MPHCLESNNNKMCPSCLDQAEDDKKAVLDLLASTRPDHLAAQPGEPQEIADCTNEPMMHGLPSGIFAGSLSKLSRGDQPASTLTIREKFVLEIYLELDFDIDSSVELADRLLARLNQTKGSQ
jgi:hypothetical protein